MQSAPDHLRLPLLTATDTILYLAQEALLVEQHLDQLVVLSALKRGQSLGDTDILVAELSTLDWAREHLKTDDAGCSSEEGPTDVAAAAAPMTFWLPRICKADRLPAW